MLTFITLFLSGCIVGLAGAFLGIGGGVIIIPLLTVVFNYPVHEAVATSLAIVVANSVSASSKYLKSGIANLPLAFLVAIFTVAGSITGGIISVNTSAKVLYITLACAQFLTLALMLAKPRLMKMAKPKTSGGAFQAEYHDTSLGQTTKYGVYHIPSLCGISGVTGTLSGLVGIGGGVMIVPIMNIFSGIPIKAAVATSSFIMGFTAGGGAIVFFLSGYTRPETIAAMVPGIFLASHFAAGYMHKVNGEKLYKGFMLFLFVVACQMMYRGISQ
ncbi:MAG: sulfite exporter TauE/SafE family protein [Deferribacteraceae bacterium]|jgi:uncharacterized membrane protein YfcA|nr:sulfite exporter TauE/SafE family protein [Deferribacteraceae bacterium]